MLMRELFRAQELVMEMQMGMDSLWFHLNPPLPPAFSGQEAFSYYPAFAAAVMTNNKRDVDPTPPPPPPSRSKAAARKDRHSKICTAGGRRNRRMRLPQDVARRFFALQENLGFDTASKTMQWLLDKSTAGINHLIGTTASMSLSEEDGSVLLDLDNNDHIMVANAETNKQQMMPKAKRRSAPAAPRKKSNNGGATVLLLPDKASRARARERARERTKERNRLRSEAPAPARQLVVPVLPVACSNSYYEVEQEPWELGGVVFAKPYVCFN